MKQTGKRWINLTCDYTHNTHIVSVSRETGRLTYYYKLSYSTMLRLIECCSKHNGQISEYNNGWSWREA